MRQETAKGTLGEGEPEDPAGYRRVGVLLASVSLGSDLLKPAGMAGLADRKWHAHPQPDLVTACVAGLLAVQGDRHYRAQHQVPDGFAAAQQQIAQPPPR